MQDTPISPRLRALHDAVLDIVGMMNGPARDELLIREAGIRLDRALFPLLVLVGRLGPLGVVELADRVGRDYTTVSRQLGRLEAQGLVERRPSDTDRRVRAMVITPAGSAMTARIDTARDRLLRAGLADWADGEIDDLVRLVRRFADAMQRDETEG